jgi:hypothetical protein
MGNVYAMTKRYPFQQRLKFHARLIWGVVLWGMLWQTAISHAQSAPIPIDAFWTQLADTQRAVQQVERKPALDHLSELGRLADELTAITAVSTPNGQHLPLNTNIIITELRTIPPDFERIDALLTTLLAARDSWPSPLFDRSAKTPLEAILSDPQFQYNTEPTWLQKQIQNLRQRWVDFLSSLLPDDSVINIPLGNIISIFAAIGLVLILFYVTKDLFLEFAGNATLNPEDEIGGEPLTADTALKRAQTFSEGGDYRTAVRYLYLSALLLLEERGLLRYNRSLTNREYLRSVAHLPELSAILHEVIDVFDRVWYGFQPLAEQEYRMYANRVDMLKQQKGS